jgi:hypothetical protein
LLSNLSMSSKLVSLCPFNQSKTYSVFFSCSARPMRDMNYHYSNIKWCLHPQGVVVWLRVEAPIPVPFYSDFTRYLYSYPFMGTSFSYPSTDRVPVRKKYPRLQHIKSIKKYL